MPQKKLKLVLALLSLVLVLSACSVTTSSTGGSGGTDSSLFLSTDAGNTWRSVAAVPTIDGRLNSISDVNVNIMTMDPQDPLAIYLGTYDHGLYYTYNATKGWVAVSGLPTTTINDIRVDPKNKCIIYGALANRVYRTSDCARTWTQIYFDNNAGVTVNTIAIDHYNTANLYIGTSRGEIIKSIDSGTAWRTIQRLDDGITRLLISPLDSRLIFVASAKNKIYSFNSNTDTNAAYSDDVTRNFIVDNWTDLNAVLSDYDLGASFKDIVINANDGSIFLATEKLILRSPDNGITWENIKLLQPEKDAVINAVAVDPQNSSNIYYVTNTTFFKSTDNGTTWTTKNLPTSRAGRELLIDFNNPNNIYLGTVKLK